MIDIETIATPAMPDARHWIVARTFTGREAEAASDLSDRDVAFLVPCYRVEVRRRHTKAVKRVERRALLPGYIFVGINTPRDWMAIRKCRPIIGVLQNDGEPARVPAASLASLHSLCQSGAFDQVTRPTPAMAWKAGDRVKVASGPLAGLAMVFKRGNIKRGTARLLGMILGHDTEVSVPLTMLEAA